MDSPSRALQEALRIAIDSLGGMKAVGSRLKPEMDPILAREWLSHCLQRDRRERITLEQIAWIFREARAAGKHTGFEVLAELLGYRVTSIIDAKEELADVTRRAVAAAHESAELSQKAMALAEALHLNVDAVAGK